MRYRRMCQSPASSHDSLPSTPAARIHSTRRSTRSVFQNGCNTRIGRAYGRAIALAQRLSIDDGATGEAAGACTTSGAEELSEIRKTG